MKKEYSIMKTILFVAGLLLIIAAAIVIYPIQHFAYWQHYLLWAVIALIYCAVFLPLVVHTRDREKDKESSGRVFAGGAVYYRGVVIFAVVSAVILVFAFLTPVSAPLFIILECAAVLLFLMYFFLACFTSEHIREVEQEEKEKLWSVADLREKAGILAINARRLGADQKELVASAEKFAEDVRYLAPSEDPTALDLEYRMAAMIDQISEDLMLLSAQGCSVETAKVHFTELNTLYERRKAIY